MFIKSFAHADSCHIVQVETSIFAMNFKKPPLSIPFEFDSSSCEEDLVLPLLHVIGFKNSPLNWLLLLGLLVLYFSRIRSIFIFGVVPFCAHISSAKNKTLKIRKRTEKVARMDET